MAARSDADAAWVRLSAHEPVAAGRLQTAASKLRVARDALQTALSSAPTERPAGADEAFVRAVAEAQNAVEAESDRIERAVGELSSNLGQLVGLGRMSSFLREALGLRSAMLSPMLDGTRIDPARLREMDELGGVAAGMWNRIRLTTAQMPDQLSIVAAAAATAGTVMGGGERTYRELIDALRYRRQPRMGVREFRLWTSPMLANALLVRDAAFAAAGDRRRAAERQALARVWQGAVIAVSALAVAVGASIQVMRRVARPLSKLTDAVGKIAEGHLDMPVPGAGRRDEIGEAASAVLVLRDKVADAERLRSQTLEEDCRKMAAARELTEAAGRFEEASRAALSGVARAETMLSASARAIGDATGRTAAEARGASAGVALASGSVASVASEIEKLSASVGHASRRMSAAASAAKSAAAGAELAAGKMGELEATARRIEDVLRLITKISSRSRLLALNASIEAARAGAAGRGFAVVASEVKGLAAQTSDATADVGGLVAAIFSATGLAMDAIRTLSAEVAAVSGATSEVAAIIETQGVATERIAAAAHEAANGTSAAMGKVAAAADQTDAANAAAATLPGIAAAVSGAMGALRGDIGAFLGEVQVAA